MVYRITVFSMFVLLVGCAFTLRAQSPSAPEELLESVTSFYTSIETADAEVRINLLADDVILMPNHWTMIRGKDAVSEVLRIGSGKVFKLKDREVVSMEVGGDIAYTVNSYYYTYNEKNEEEQWHKTKNVHIWRRDSSGQWKLVVDIWNSDVPMAQFELE